MSSFRQKEANRRNALKSTGPATCEGKQRSRCNAVRHGLTAETVITAFENTEDYEAFQAAVTSDYDAETAVERELVLRLASVLWRLRRSTLIETALFEVVAEASHQQQSESLDQSADPLNPPHIFLTATVDAQTSEEDGSGSNIKGDIVQCFLRLADLPKSAYFRLSRYEQALWRQARQLVLTLESLRRRSLQVRRSSFPFSYRQPEPTS